MQSINDNIINILYSPVMYTHSEQLSMLTPLKEMIDETILNYWIIKTQDLDDLPDNWHPNDVISELILSHWEAIPRIAMLIGGYLLREQVIMEKTYLINDIRLLRFLSLPLRHTITMAHQNSHIDYLALGASFVTGLANHLPNALQQRLRLFFPQGVLLHNIGTDKTPDHINLLRMAAHYAYDT